MIICATLLSNVYKYANCFMIMYNFIVILFIFCRLVLLTLKMYQPYFIFCCSIWNTHSFVLLFTLIIRHFFLFLGCNCPNTSCCSFCDKNVVIISNETLQERIKQLVRELTIDKTTLSSYRNTKISADDQRVSSRGIGSGAAIILVTLVLLLVLSDTPLVVTQLKLLKQNISQGFRQFRGS